MPTSQASIRTPTLTDAPSDAAEHGVLRLELAHTFGNGPLDGAWWPHSSDLQQEVGDLVDHFPRGRIDHLIYSRPDWAAPATRVRTARGSIKIGSFPRDDTHVVLLKLASRQVVRQREFASLAVRNQAFLRAALAYCELLRAEGTPAP